MYLPVYPVAPVTVWSLFVPLIRPPDRPVLSFPQSVLPPVPGLLFGGAGDLQDPPPVSFLQTIWLAPAPPSARPRT